MDLYIYYKVRDGDQAALHSAVAAMQAELRSTEGVSPLLKRRPTPSSDGVWTWMEVYPQVRDGFDAVLADAVRARGIAALTSGPRHTEIFTEF
jgi:hypothetical protein